MDRHLPLVYSVALRVSGSPELAAEAAQDVFLELIRTPAVMKKEVALLAWLHRGARHRAIDMIRSEIARKRRERSAMADASHDSEALSGEALAMLDEVIEGLPARDRQLVLARYFAGHSLASIGLTAGLSEDAVRMRLARALEKMRAAFGARGIAASAAMLASSLPLQAVTSVPPMLSSGIRATVTAAASTASSASFFSYFTAMNSTQKVLAAVILLLAAGAAGKAYFQSTTPSALPSAPPASSAATHHPGNTSVTTPISMAFATDEAARIDRVLQWLKDTSPEGQNETMRQRAMVSQLGLGAVRLLLSDPALIKDIQGPERDDGFPNPVYPRRDALGSFLWEQFGKLSPQEALDRLATIGAQPEASFEHTGSALIGVAKADPALALHFLGDLPERVTESSIIYSLESLMPSLVKYSKQETFRAILSMPELSQREAYLAYVGALPQGTDWPTEIDQLKSGLPGFEEGASGSLAGRWACSDPDAAFGWLAAASKDSSFGYLDAIRCWMWREPSQAIKWLGSWNPDGLDRDRLFANVLVYGGAGDIRMVDGLLELISAPDARTAAAQQTMKNMGDGMETEELRHLQNSPLLSVEAKRSIEETILANQNSGLRE
ncbi:RNA polymerase sigma factor [Haloferula sp. BvORR071]|uniref:RNA polymerase sigma factor n=1 Tax=Haloferula sp. BvORR071 TaxID=1396141 RepID=UPI002240F2A8|nr:RNA polymerase sigma factor [Haloferula sp. BvORR071]